MINRLQGTGLAVSPSQWGWGNHYLWRLFASVVATLLAGFLPGAIAQKRGGIVAAISNIPSVILWMVMIFILWTRDNGLIYGDQTISTPTGMIVISILAIPLTTYFAYASGQNGCQVQQDDFQPNTVLGIASYHWAWLVIPIYFYMVGSIYPIMNVVISSFDVSIIGSLITAVTAVVALISFAPLIIVYYSLKSPAINVAKAFGKAISNTVILVIGYAIVVLLQIAYHWIITKLAP